MWDKDKGHEPPHLALEHGGRIEGEGVDEGVGRIHGAQQPHSERAEYDIEHQVVHAEPRVLVAEQVHLFHKAAHIFTSVGEFSSTYQYILAHFISQIKGEKCHMSADAGERKKFPDLRVCAIMSRKGGGYFAFY